MLCDKRLKGTFYREAIRPTIIYGVQCWPIKQAQTCNLEVTEMRMLRWMCGCTRMDRIHNEVYHDTLGVAPIGIKFQDSRLRWFGHLRTEKKTYFSSHEEE